MPRDVLLAVVPFALLVPGVAFSQEVDAESGRPIKYAERTEIDVPDALELQGELVGPEIIPVGSRSKADFDSFVVVRANFDKELRSSVDHVK